jgi:hypothetical protein
VGKVMVYGFFHGDQDLGPCRPICTIYPYTEHNNQYS